MRMEDLEQKKLICLYPINDAKTQLALVTLTVNTFVRDSEGPSPFEPV